MTVYNNSKANINENKILALSESIWSNLNRIDYDPYHPLFEYCASNIKNEINRMSRFLLEGCYN